MDQNVLGRFVLHWNLVYNVSGLRMMGWNRFLADGYNMRDLAFMQTLRSGRSSQAMIERK